MKIHSLIALFALLSLSSCFEIIEEVELNANGSGNYEYTLNFSQSRTKLDQIMRMDSINGYRIPDRSELKEPMEELMARARSIQGISKVNKVEDFENYIFSFTCDFTDIEALNRLVAELRKSKKDTRTDIPEDHFTYNTSTKKYMRNGSYSIGKDFDKMNDADKVIFDGATFTSIFRSDTEIASFSNSSARISPNKTALMLRIDILDLIHERQHMGNTIQLTK